MEQYNANEGVKIKTIIDDVSASMEKGRLELLKLVSATQNEIIEKEKKLAAMSTLMGSLINDMGTRDQSDKERLIYLAEIACDFKNNKEIDKEKLYKKLSRHNYSESEIKKHIEEIKTNEELLDLVVEIGRMLNTINNTEDAINNINIASRFFSDEFAQTVESIKINRNISLGLKILEAQENERKRISSDIHDGPAQYIANIVMKADFCEILAKENIDLCLTELGELKGLTRQALKETRSIIYDLRPMSLDDLGFNKTLEVYVGKYSETTSINVKLTLCDIMDTVESIVQVAMFRVIQETLNNVKKHSRAQNVFLTIENKEDSIKVNITDDGVGFDVKSTFKKIQVQSTSYGILGIMDRIEQLNGIFNITSFKNQGSTYSILIPISQEVIKHD